MLHEPRSTNSAVVLTLFPPYTPEYNPIELMFAQVKAAYFRSMYETGTRPRDAIDAAFAVVSSKHCRNYFEFVEGESTGRNRLGLTTSKDAGTLSPVRGYRIEESIIL